MYVGSTVGSTLLDLTNPNTFHATPLNNYPASPAIGINSSKFTAQFRIANWGSAGLTSPEWHTTCRWNGSGTNVTYNSRFDLKCDWTVPDPCAYEPADAGCGPTAGTKNPHQCVLVDLGMANTGSSDQYTFSAQSVFRNMNFDVNSTLVREATIDIKGLGAMPDGSANRDVYLYVHTRNLPAKIADEPPARDKLQQRFKELRLPATGAIGTQDSARIQAAVKAGTLTVDQVEEIMPTYIVYVWHDTGRKLRTLAGNRKLLEAQPPFGLFLAHDGDIEGWKHELAVAGATLIGPNFYKLSPPNDSTFPVTITIQPVEPGVSRGFWIILGAGPALAPLPHLVLLLPEEVGSVTRRRPRSRRPSGSLRTSRSGSCRSGTARCRCTRAPTSICAAQVMRARVAVRAVRALERLVDAGGANRLARRAGARGRVAEVAVGAVARQLARGAGGGERDAGGAVAAKAVGRVAQITLVGDVAAAGPAVQRDAAAHAADAGRAAEPAADLDLTLAAPRRSSCRRRIERRPGGRRAVAVLDAGARAAPPKACAHADGGRTSPSQKPGWAAICCRAARCRVRPTVASYFACGGERAGEQRPARRPVARQPGRRAARLVDVAVARDEHGARILVVRLAARSAQAHARDSGGEHDGLEQHPRAHAGSITPSGRA